MTTDVRVSWVELDACVQPVDVRVSWVELDAGVQPVDMRVSWVELDADERAEEQEKQNGGGLIRQRLPNQKVRSPDLPLENQYDSEQKFSDETLQDTQPVSGKQTRPTDDKQNESSAQFVANLLANLPASPNSTPAASTQSAPIGVTNTQPAQPGLPGEGAGGSQPTQVAVIAPDFVIAQAALKRRQDDDVALMMILMEVI